MTSLQSHTPDSTDQVEISFLEGVRRRSPDHVPLLLRMGELYTRLGRFREGLDVDILLTQLEPKDSLVWYNLSCSYSLLSKLDEGIHALSEAIDLGYDDVEHMLEDLDLENLRTYPGFDRLVDRLEQAEE